MFFEQKNLTSSEIEQKEVEFGSILVDLEKSAILWKELRDFFANKSAEDYKFSYWRWFVELTWYRLNVLPKEELSEVLAKQVPSALLQNYNVQDELVRYLGLRVLDELEMQSLYLKIQQAFFESEAVVGIWQGKNITVSEVIKEINSFDNAGDSLLQADFETRLRQIMSPADEISKKYFTADPERAKEEFLDLVSFFQTFTQENIWYVVDLFINPEKYQNAAPGQVSSATTPVVSTAASSKLVVPQTIRPSAPSTPAPKPAVPPQPAPTTKPLAPAKPTPVQSPIVEPQARLTTGQVKSQIESQFKKDAEGNFADIEGVMAKLNDLAEKNNDPKIADMIYFDETENKFKWNI